MAAQTSPEVTPQKEDNLSTVIVVGGKKMYANLSTVIVVACAGHSQLRRPQPFGCRSPGEHMQNVPSEETFTTPDATASSNRWTVTETALRVSRIAGEEPLHQHGSARFVRLPA